jgi:hypothetical protein
MARSNGWIGGSRRSPARNALRILAALALGFLAGSLPSPAQSAPPTSPTPTTSPAPPAKTAATAPKTPPSKDAPPTAKEPLRDILRERARTAMEANELAESRAALLALQVIDPTIHSACNLGLVARRLSLWVEAAENLSRCVRAFTAVPPASRDIRRYDQFRAELAMARAMVASLRLATPLGARVTIGGAVFTSLTPDREIFLKPGQHLIEVGSQRRQLDLRPGSATSLDFTRPPLPKPEGVDWVAFSGWSSAATFAAAGGGGLVLSEIFRVSATSKLSALEQADGRTCLAGGRNATSCSAMLREEATANVLRFVSIGSLALSGALFTGSILRTTSEKPPRARVLVGLGGVGVEASW